MGRAISRVKGRANKFQNQNQELKEKKQKLGNKNQDLKEE
jgi:hypothetical protein